jgi:hypothetical protein
MRLCPPGRDGELNTKIGHHRFIMRVNVSRIHGCYSSRLAVTVGKSKTYGGCATARSPNGATQLLAVHHLASLLYVLVAFG